MNYVELAPGISSSVIGFGCASMMGAVDRTRSVRALELALDSGINHFDTAPSYGYGESEKLLGEVLAGRRDKVVIASKFGIVVSPAGIALRPLKSSARAVLGWLRRRRVDRGAGTSSGGSAIGGRFHRHVPLTAASMERSVDRSLKRLRTDHLDYLFLHDPIVPVEKPDQFYACVRRLKEAGKIRAFGLAAMTVNLPTHERDLPQFDVLQFGCPVEPAEYDQMKLARGGKPNVLFSPFRARAARSTAGSEDPLVRIRRDFPESVILCSMFSEAHVRQNAAAGEADS